MTIEFSDEPTPPGDIVETDKSVHETVRKAIACCKGEDKIVLSLDSAMGLIMEWDTVLRGKKA